VIVLLTVMGKAVRLPVVHGVEKIKFVVKKEANHIDSISHYGDKAESNLTLPFLFCWSEKQTL